MNDERILTMSDILSGKEQTHDVFIKALDGKVKLRPLGLDEIAKAQGFTVRAINVRAQAPLKSGAMPDVADLNFNLKDLFISEAESQIHMAAMGLSCNGEKWTVDQARQIRPADAVKQIAEAVEKISGADTGVANRLKPFRTLTRRPDVSVVDAGGPEAGGQHPKPDTPSS